MMKRTIIFVMLLSSAIAAWAEQRITISGVQYTTLSENTVEAALTVKAVGDLQIAESIRIKGRAYKTIRIAKAFFKKNAYLTSVIIPASVTQIDDLAFQGCSNLSKVFIASEECEVSDRAFDGCMALADVHKGTGSNDPNSKANGTPHVAQRIRNSDIDRNIPECRQTTENTFALIIGNEDYKRATAVPYATNDAEVFADYCAKTLGIPQSNIDLYTNATQGDIRHGIQTLCNRLAAYQGEASAIVYYAGHGIPDESEKTGYLLPIDGFPSDVHSAYSLAELYKQLSEVSSQQVLIFLDACFSGAKRDGEMISEARGVAIRINKTIPKGKLFVFSAATGDQTAYCDKEQGHGIFTYFLLKHLQNTEGKTTLGLLTEDVREKVQRRSVVLNNGKLQTPTAIPSPSLGDQWQKMTLK